MQRCYYQATGRAASAAEIRSALDLLEARAQFDGPERKVHVRIAEHYGRIYLDLADEQWRAVDIGPDGTFEPPCGYTNIPTAALPSSMARAALCVSIRKDEPMMSPLAAAATTAADN